MAYFVNYQFQFSRVKYYKGYRANSTERWVKQINIGHACRSALWMHMLMMIMKKEKKKKKKKKRRRRIRRGGGDGAGGGG